MTYIPPEVFPGAWIDQYSDDETVLDSNESSPGPDPALDKTRDAIADHAAVTVGMSDRDDGPVTKEDVATGSQPQSDDKNSEMTEPNEPPPELFSNMDVDGRSRKVSIDEPPTKKIKVTLLDASLDSSDAMDVDPAPTRSSKHTETNLDLLHSIKGMFRVLDLISEQGRSISKTLDKVNLRAVGLYGSQSELIAFLSSQGVINTQMWVVSFIEGPECLKVFSARALNNSADNSSVPHLRSGLYVLRASDTETAASQQVFVIYWPESTTWNDDAISSVCRNRVTFMRYLTKVSDQAICLISPDHARTIVWNDEAEDNPMDIEEGSDRLFTFEVAKTNEQEETVSVAPGFTMNASVLFVEPPHVECTLDVSKLEPTEFLKHHRLYSFGPTLADEGIEILMGHGLNSRFPAPFKAWKARNKAAEESIEAEAKKEEQDTKQKLTDASPKSEPLLREAIIDKLIALYPTINRGVLSSTSAEDLEVLRAQYTDLITLHPKLKDEVEKEVEKATLPRISSKFKDLKEQLFCIDILLEGVRDLEAPDREHLIEHITKLGVDGLSAALKSKDSSGESKGWMVTIKGWLSDGQPTDEQRIRRKIRERIKATTDSKFLANLNDMLSREPLLQNLITQTIDEANEQFQGTVQSLLPKLVGKSVLIQLETFKAQIQRKAAGKLEEQRKNSRDQLNEEYERTSQAGARTLTFEGIERNKRGSESFKIDGTDKSRTEPAIECKLHILHLTADNQQNIQLDSKSMPSPHLQANSVQVFRLSIGRRILHAQLIDGGKLLLIIEDLEHLYIFLENPSALEHAVSRGRAAARRVLHRDKTGKDATAAGGGLNTKC
ncbi:hypothetical protein B0H12DRAFT_1246842 [Mycena haematopus]|nr:hypothetical protein B0H12DRAFT_1246842 [Mycena haematopus]